MRSRCVAQEAAMTRGAAWAANRAGQARGRGGGGGEGPCGRRKSIKETAVARGVFAEEVAGEQAQPEDDEGQRPELGHLLDERRAGEVEGEGDRDQAHEEAEARRDEQAALGGVDEPLREE